MNDIIANMSLAFTSETLLSMLKGCIIDKKTNDVALKIIAASLTLSWLDEESISDISKMVYHVGKMEMWGEGL